LDHTTDPDTAASIDAAAVRVSGRYAALAAQIAARLERGLEPKHCARVKVWLDEPCPHHSRMMPNRHCRRCDGTGRILEPASS